MARTIVGVLIGIGFVGAVIYVGLSQNKVNCEVCMVYQGRQKCESSAAVDRAQAMMQATNSACVQISGGVSDGIRCNNTPPLSSQCSE